MGSPDKYFVLKSSPLGLDFILLKIARPLRGGGSREDMRRLGLARHSSIKLRSQLIEELFKPGKRIPKKS
jgi:hypothetical protein